ncbi:MAG: hypothetical protein MZU97_09410 [Bacillus subtilis]|nr:hypothetical protein [Bacillus subtilis]
MLAGRAAARRRQREHRRGQGAVLPDHHASPDRWARSAARSPNFLTGRRRPSGRSSAGLFQPIFQRRPDQAELRGRQGPLRPGAGAVPAGGAERATARWRMRSSRSRSSAERRTEIEYGVEALRDAVAAVALALRRRPRRATSRC